nr:protein HHL1, chloroplastic isoform X1 [Tanacetum cinerariifolium]
MADEHCSYRLISFAHVKPKDRNKTTEVKNLHRNLFEARHRLMVYMWYPVSIVTGGTTAKIFIAGKDNFVGKYIYKDALNKNLAGVICEDEKEVQKTAVRHHLVLCSATEFRYGYKLVEGTNIRASLASNDVIELPTKAELKTVLDKVIYFFGDAKESFGKLTDIDEDTRQMSHVMCKSEDIHFLNKSFPRGMSCGRDGLRAQHLINDLSGSDVIVSYELVFSITQVVNLFLDGSCPKMLGEYIASAPLTPLVKPCGGIHFIVVGTVWRRLVSKVSALMICHSLDGYLDDLQFGVRVSRGSEAILHAVNRLIEGRGDDSAELPSKLLRNTDIVAFGPNFDNALYVFNRSMETDFLSNPSEIVAPKLMKKMTDIYFTRVAKNAESAFSLSHRQMALWKSQMEDHTSDWLRTVPISGLGQTMNACSRVFVGDIYRDHVVSCVGIIGIKHRHNIVRDTLVDICYRLRFQLVVIDTAQRKRETDAVILLKRIQKFFMTQDIGARATVYIFNKIGFSIAKGVGA